MTVVSERELRSMVDKIETPEIIRILSVDHVMNDQDQPVVMVVIEMASGKIARLPMSPEVAVQLLDLLERISRDQGWKRQVDSIESHPLQ